MARKCEICGKKLSIFYSDNICKECKINLQKQFKELQKEVVTKKEFDSNKFNNIKKYYNKQKHLELFNYIYYEFEKDHELDSHEIELLSQIQNYLGLSDEDIKYEERIRPYIIVSYIKENNQLPDITSELRNKEIKENFGNIILKRGELVHFASFTVLKEIRSVSLGYQGGSQGISIRIAKGVRYRIGAHKGHIVRENRLVDTSKGLLLLSNKRLFLQPLPRNKPVSIPINKIMSYHVYENGLEVYKEGRQKGFFFAMNAGESEISGICLEFLLSNLE